MSGPIGSVSDRSNTYSGEGTPFVCGTAQPVLTFPRFLTPHFVGQSKRGNLFDPAPEPTDFWVPIDIAWLGKPHPECRHCGCVCSTVRDVKEVTMPLGLPTDNSNDIVLVPSNIVSQAGLVRFKYDGKDIELTVDDQVAAYCTKMRAMDQGQVHFVCDIPKTSFRLQKEGRPVVSVAAPVFGEGCQTFVIKGLKEEPCTNLKEKPWTKVSTLLDVGENVQSVVARVQDLLGKGSQVVESYQFVGQDEPCETSQGLVSISREVVGVQAVPRNECGADKTGLDMFCCGGIERLTMVLQPKAHKLLVLAERPHRETAGRSMISTTLPFVNYLTIPRYAIFDVPENLDLTNAKLRYDRGNLQLQYPRA